VRLIIAERERLSVQLQQIDGLSVSVGSQLYPLRVHDGRAVKLALEQQGILDPLLQMPEG